MTTPFPPPFDPLRVKADVTGITAGTADFNSMMNSSMPLVFAFVLDAAFLLLMFTFRSIVIPIKAILLNLLSVGAAYGVLVLVFQHGSARACSASTPPGDHRLAAAVPVRGPVRALDGLPRVHPQPDPRGVRHRHEDRRGRRHGIKSTAGVVTSAAVVMVAVFSIFATLSSIEFKQMGVGLAAAILIDATIIRGVLLPATMKLLGDWNWYLPRWLGWLPQVAHERRSAQRAEPEPA